MPFFAASEAPPRPESMKFPVFSLLAGNLAFSETSSQLTPPSPQRSAHSLAGSSLLEWRVRGPPGTARERRVHHDGRWAGGPGRVARCLFLFRHRGD